MSEQQQFELFDQAPWIVRQRAQESLQLWWDHDWSKTVKASTTRKAFKRIVAFWENRYVDDLTKADMTNLRADLKARGLRDNTINTHHNMVVRWINWLTECKKLGVVDEIDFRRMSLPKENFAAEVPRIDEARFRRNVAWPKRVIWKLVGASQRLNDQEMADIIDALYITKLRPGDVWEITDQNIDLAHKILQGIQHKTIRRSMPSGLPYVKTITPRLETIFRRRMALRQPGEPIFRDPAVDHEAWRRQIVKRFSVVRQYAGLPHVQIRDLRPSGATLELDNGIDPLSVSQGLGHSFECCRCMPVGRWFIRRRRRKNLKTRTRKF